MGNSLNKSFAYKMSKAMFDSLACESHQVGKDGDIIIAKQPINKQTTARVINHLNKSLCLTREVTELVIEDA